MEITQKEHEHQIHLANHWVIRFHVARALCKYFNEIYMPGSHFFDVDEEIKAQSKRLIKMYDDGMSMHDVMEEWGKGYL